MDFGKGSHEIYQGSTKKINEIKEYFFRLLPFWVAGSITALVATSYARLFALAEETSQEIYAYTGVWFIFIPPVLFFASWYLVEKFAPRSNGSGIPQLMASIDYADQKKLGLIDQFLGFKIIAIKVLSSLAAVIGGGAIGREGPTLQISGSIFHLISKNWRWSGIQNKSAFLMAGAASGLASAFNTPLGGIVYVIEELAKSHLQSFRTGVLHAVIFAGIISQMIMGPYLYLGYPKVPAFEYNFIWQYIIIALMAAASVACFSEMLKYLVIWRAKLKSFFTNGVFTIVSGLLFGLLVVFVSNKSMGPGKDLLNNLLFNPSDISSGVDVIARFFGSLLTYANGGAGGIFAPILSLGGSAGSFLNGLFNFDLGSLAVLIGMTSGLAALTHSPLTSFILILEMTDRHRSIFPLMLAALIGHGLSRMVSHQSFYEFVYESLLKSSEPNKELPKPE